MSIRYALLALLSSGPKHGFQLAHDFEAGTGEMWPLNTGQVYTTLQRLERDGLVDADDDAEGPQNVFHLTDAGRDELAEWLRTPPDLATPPRDELVIKLLVALRVPGIDPAELSQIHRRHLIETMHEYTRLKEDARRTRHRSAARRRRRDLPTRSDGPLARRRRCPHQAPADTARRPLASQRRQAPRPPQDRSPPMSPMLVLSNVSKSYGEGPARVDALVEIDLTVEPGELVAIMGPSGSGKSTLLTIAGTLEEATAGEVTIDGQPVSAMSRSERGMPAPPQRRVRLPGLQPAARPDRGRERGAAARARRHALPRWRATSALAALDQLGLTARADRYPEAALRRRAPARGDRPRRDR